jgi:hypothetical protein
MTPIRRWSLKPTDLILRRRKAPSRRMAARSVPLGRPSRRAQSFEARAPSGARAPQDEVRAPQDEVIDCVHMIRSSETQH